MRVPPAGRRRSAVIVTFLALILTGSAAASREAATGVRAAEAQKPRASLFVAPTGADGRSCRSPQMACASFDRAYRVARPGEIVEVAGGRYESQSIRTAGTRSGPNVVFRPAARARVVLGGLTLGSNDMNQGPDRLTIRNMELAYKGAGPGARNQEGIWVGPGSSYVRLEHMDAGAVHTWFADHITILGGDYGPCDAVWGSENVCGNTKFDVSSNITVDGALFHDYRFDATCFSVAGADCHWECMYVNAGENITIRNSKFRDCTIYDIFVTISGPDAARIGHRNLLIENNWFDTPWTEDRSGGQRARATGVSLAWCQNSSQGYKDVLVRFNSFQRNTGIELDRNMSCRWENVRIIGNLLSYPGNCDPRITYGYNVWTSAIRPGRCAGTDRQIGDAMPYAQPASGRGFNFRLRSSRTVADDLVPTSAPGGCPRVDIDRARRLGKRCDAGSDERRPR
jgi:hypothetical protein